MANHFDAVIIGGGAAGLLCAGFAARRGMRVAVLEKNGRPARKVRITGKGRCNVTNNCDNNDFIRAVRGNGRFLYSAIAAFSTADTMAFFEGLGVPLKTERGNRVFPVSDQATDIVDALVGFAKDGGA
ncbi:MAG: aminoacetone oxidase family FAD-binding enzyme, partial [Oscillospiraceae bacterium]